MKPIRILLVDDDKDVLDVLGMLFDMDGHVVRFAECYSEALALVEAEPFDVVISDYRMPRMHGLYLLDMIKDIRPDLPVVLMSAYHSDDLEKNAMNKRAEGLLRKPFEYTELMRMVESAMVKER